MRFFVDFLRQKVPAPGKVMPVYYRRALYASYFFLVCYFIFAFFFFPFVCQCWEWIPAVLCLISSFSLVRIHKMNILQNFGLFSLIILFWCAWGIYQFGWSYGVQHFLIILLLFLFFNICISPSIKIIICLLFLVFRMGLFAYSRIHVPIYLLSETMGILFQTVNSSGFFLLVAVICILFSSSIQDTERKLRLDNETLNKEAGTDPLTGLPNRREMISIIEKYQKTSPEASFSVAIADIDYFKNVNDTYGHACGDMTLVALTSLFKEFGEKTPLQACRWGGEEFCFFLPQKNLDEAGAIMNDLNLAVERMPLEFEGTKFNITITIGVEETDFKSTLESLLKSADEKLYLGKNTGRNRVVV